MVQQCRYPNDHGTRGGQLLRNDHRFAGHALHRERNAGEPERLPFDGTGNYGPSYASFYDITGYTGMACPGQCNGILAMPMVSLGGTAPFTVDFSVASTYQGLDGYGFPYYAGFCEGDMVNYTITDAFGCQGSDSFVVMGLAGGGMPGVSDIQGACAGSNIGSFTLNQWSGISQYTITDGMGNTVVPETMLYEFGSVTYDGLAAGMYILNAYPLDGQCLVNEYITVGDLGPGCTQVQGQAWFDQDADCVFDAGEVGVPGSVLVVEPGTQYAITCGDGHYSFNLPTGNYTIAQTDPTLEPYCPTTLPAPFTLNGPTVTIDFANNSTSPLDLHAHIGSGWARPGFPHAIHASAVNGTAQITGAVEVIITIDPTVSIASVVPTPTTTAGNVLTWQLAELDYFGSQGFSIQTTVPVGTPLGTLLNHGISVSSANPDADLSDNTDLTAAEVQGSFDPNDKTAVTSSRQSGTLYFINADDWIDYTIRFQNTGTAEAFFVTITDTLPEELDMTSFQMGVASHAHNVTFKPGRVVEWYFDNINLPDSTTDLAGSQGFVKFRIRPAQPLQAGTVIQNTANIYFDFNDPVITEPSLLVAEFSTGSSEGIGSGTRIFPNPVEDRLTVHWADGQHPLAFRILSADGRVVQQVAAGRSSVDVSGLVSGLYTLQSGVGSWRFVKR